MPLNKLYDLCYFYSRYGLGKYIELLTSEEFQAIEELCHPFVKVSLDREYTSNSGNKYFGFKVEFFEKNLWSHGAEFTEKRKYPLHEVTRVYRQLKSNGWIFEIEDCNFMSKSGFYESDFYHRIKIIDPLDDFVIKEVKSDPLRLKSSIEEFYIISESHSLDRRKLVELEKVIRNNDFRISMLESQNKELMGKIESLMQKGG